jgi:hypothetical protein
MSRAAGPWAPPPYEQPGGDGQVYFKVLPPIPGLVTVWRDGLTLVNQLRAMRSQHPAAGPKAALLAKALADMERAIVAGELQVAALTDVQVTSRIRSTQVRPDNPRGPRLLTAIESRPIRPLGSPVPLFSVGQADVSLMDKATQRRAARKPYWRAQEFGYGGNVGRVVRGAFFPGGVRPDPGQFRVHPVFLRSSSTRVHVMKIGRPIEERAFLRSGAMAAALERSRIWRGIERRTLAEMRRAATFRSPAMPPRPSRP